MKRFILILLLALSIRIAFLAYTDFVAEDAHITFQFARNIARGDGFSAIPGIPVYGSTTPLLTLILAGWLGISENIVLGARLVDLLAFAGGAIFLYSAIPNRRAAIFVMLLIAVSGRMIAEEMQGMEMPLLFLFMMGSFYGFMKEKPVLAGIMAGLMLWTRVDALVWVGTLWLIYTLLDWNSALKFAVVVSSIYLPWILFAWWYFGSPIPLTIIAKQVAYGINSPPYLVHLGRILDYLTPGVVAGAAITVFVLKDKRYWIFPLFSLIEVAVLVISGATFFSRYFYSLTLMMLILLGIGIDYATRFLLPKYLTPLAVILIFVFSAGGENRVYSTIERIITSRNIQRQTYSALRDVGKWLHDNSPENSTVMLEPLGYVGWYADRVMIDEVGLTTPEAIELHRQGVEGAYFFKYFLPDYVVWYCDSQRGREEINNLYTVVKVFDDVGELKRVCYEIWKKDKYAQN